jgi:hypothetical protein
MYVNGKWNLLKLPGMEGEDIEGEFKYDIFDIL